MRHTLRTWTSLVVFAIGLAGMPPAEALAQLDVPPLRFAPAKDSKVTHSLVADVQSITPGQTFRVGILFQVKEGAYFYYRTAGSLGLPTRVVFEVPEGVTLGPTEFPVPEVKYDELDKPVIYYIYTRPTVIFAEVTVPGSVKPGESIEIRAQVNYQFCDETNCTPASDRNLSLRLPVVESNSEPSEHAKSFARAARQVPKADKAGVLSVQPFVNVSALRPNDQATLALELEVAEGFHIQMNRPPDRSLVSTEVIIETPEGLDFSVPIFPEPLQPLHPLAGAENMKEYRGRVTILVPLRARRFLEPGETTIKGLIRYQACDVKNCLPPAYADFSIRLPVAKEGSTVQRINSDVFAHAGMAEPPAAETPQLPAPSVSNGVMTPPTVASAPAQPAVVTSPPAMGESAIVGDPSPAVTPTKTAGSVLDRIQTQSDQQDLSFWVYMLYAFVGGMVLNVMPCVLPVIAIKILGFVNQAGESPWQIKLLNFSYTAGVLTVFMTLGTLAALAGYVQGTLFQNAWFNVAMASLVFAMGLSLLGMFEIPVPGFAGTIDTSKKEGPLGAYLTGVLATLLATPCLGPFLSATLAWTAKQPPATVYAIWFLMGLGMSSPYIAAAFFPKVIRLLPKPGMWMVRFKEMAGFVLMATVIFFISFLNSDYVLPLLSILLGLTVAIWMVSNLYEIGSKPGEKWLIRASAMAVIGASVFFGLQVMHPYAQRQRQEKVQAEVSRQLAAIDFERSRALTPNHQGIAWEPFTEELLKQRVEEGKTVFIDFTADWCAICKTNEFTSIETKKIEALMEEMGVVAIKADWTEKSEDISKWLHKFDGGGIPHYVVVPAKDPTKPLVFGGTLTESFVESQLRKAGPSRGFEPRASATLPVSITK
jgi:suppressor for copper-sensitivity B